MQHFGEVQKLHFVQIIRCSYGSRSAGIAHRAHRLRPRCTADGSIRARLVFWRVGTGYRRRVSHPCAQFHRIPVAVPLPLPTPRATPPLVPLVVPVIPPRAMPLPLAPLPAVEVGAPPLALPLAGVLADGTLLYLLGGLDVVGGCSTKDVSVVRKVASTSGGAVCVGMCRSEWCLESGEEKCLARAKDCGVGA